jgi:hypothetical protein
VRIRTAQIAITPIWVIKHPDVYGNATRMAVYAGLQVVAFEAGDTEWRSDRELAVSVSEVVGIGDEACRKHLAALKAIGAIAKTVDGDVYLAQDDPGLGIGVGTQEPKVGSGGTQTDERTTTTEIEKRERRASGYDGTPGFNEFWSLYPRGEGKPAAHDAFKAAAKKDEVGVILAGLEVWVDYWHRRGEPQFIPYAQKWLKGENWNACPPPVRSQAPKLSSGGSAIARRMERTS